MRNSRFQKNEKTPEIRLRLKSCARSRLRNKNRLKRAFCRLWLTMKKRKAEKIRYARSYFNLCDRPVIL